MVSPFVFSISIPVYNQAEYLPTALESIKYQKCNYEVALLDATADNSVQNCAAPYREIISYSYHHQDEGQAAAIQEGWDNTSGDIVAWLNADDYYFPHTLGAVARIFENNPDVDVVYGHGVYVTPAGEFLMYFPAISDNPSLLAKGCVILQPSCFVRRSAMERVGGLDVSLHYTMDWDFWIRLFKAGCVFHFVDEPLSLSRIYAQTKTISGGRRRVAELDMILKSSTGFLSRIRALAGFRYYDLAYTRKTFADFFMYHTLNILKKANKAFREKSEIYGLERWSNHVNTGCTIRLAWYGKTLPRQVTLVTDRHIDLDLTLHSEKLEPGPDEPCEVSVMGKKLKGYRRSATIENFSGASLTFRINSSDGPFRLLSLGLDA